MTKLTSILLIDDDLATNVYNKAIVNQSGVTEHVHVCDSGFKALEYLTTKVDGTYPQPALIFLDVNMPAMDGWEFLEKYHELPEEQRGNIVVFMLTTSLDPNDKQKSEQLGATGFIRKPLTVEQIKEIVNKSFGD